MSNPNDIRSCLEAELAVYTGAPFVALTQRCCAALQLCCEYLKVKKVTIPKRTYNGVVGSVYYSGGVVRFDDRNWIGRYQLRPYPIWDSARRFTAGMYQPGQFMCLSFGQGKILSDDAGGAILFDQPYAFEFFRTGRFDGRHEGVAPKDDNLRIAPTNGPMSVRTAAALWFKLRYHMPKHNPDLPNSDYADLSKYDWDGIWKKQREK